MPQFIFRKSSYSDHDHECVEVASNLPHTVAIRDSKRPHGPALRVSPAAWAALLSSLRTEQ
ncbi:DUF397 domain-containing protein [Streptomyces rimosus]|uniref:DUF397 domain-containing protein n=1 Tax=Streptomyces rimosus TaxID=1927 RepID=UPI0006B27588|nr:DUF397 domain-containing protein [Streptomyces rimosus]KOT80144.1 hypothetical protein ADK70_28135 [Streptomyces rimosus subsp. pseudoverticillatus]